jgi:hypothetical protein
MGVDSMKNLLKNDEGVSVVVAVLMLIMVVAGSVAGISYMMGNLGSQVDSKTKADHFSDLTSTHLNILGDENTSQVTKSMVDGFNKKQSDIGAVSYTTDFYFPASKVINLTYSGTVDIGIVDEYDTNLTNNMTESMYSLTKIPIGYKQDANGTNSTPLYAVIRKPSTSPVDRFILWLQLPEGQKIINNSGYYV